MNPKLETLNPEQARRIRPAAEGAPSKANRAFSGTLSGTHVLERRFPPSHHVFGSGFFRDLADAASRVLLGPDL